MTKQTESSLRDTTCGRESGQTPLLVSKRDAAALLSLCVRTVDNLIATKKLPARRIGTAGSHSLQRIGAVCPPRSHRHARGDAVMAASPQPDEPLVQPVPNSDGLMHARLSVLARDDP